MELSIRHLDLPSATTPIPEKGPDPYRMIQVHDYLNVSFLRMDPNVKASYKETIQVFTMAYPELLKEKFFVNVPIVMGWVFAAMKVFLSKDTVKKFHLLTWGSSLASEIPKVANQLPTAYGGKGNDLKDGAEQTKLGNLPEKGTAATPTPTQDSTSATAPTATLTAPAAVPAATPEATTTPATAPAATPAAPEAAPAKIPEAATIPATAPAATPAAPAAAPATTTEAATIPATAPAATPEAPPAAPAT